MSSQPLRNPPDDQSQKSPSSYVQADTELLLGIAKQDQACMLGLYDRYSLLACSIATHVLADSAAAEEVMQDVFWNIWKNPQAFDPARGSFRAWVTVVVRHKALDALRKRKASAPLDEDTVSARQRSQEASFISTQLYGRALEAIQRLPAVQRQLFEMSYLGGLTHVEITQQTGLPLGTVKTRLRAALDSLRKALNPDSGLKLVQNND